MTDVVTVPNTPMTDALAEATLKQQKRRERLISPDFPKIKVAEAMTLFPTDHHLRLVHYCRWATERAKAMNRNPRMIVPDFVGGHGEGKTAMFQTYVFACLGVNPANLSERERRSLLRRHLAVMQVGGITDFAELTGQAA